MSNTIQETVRVTKEIYHSKDYYTFACVSLDENSKIKVNKYGNFIIAGDLSFLKVGSVYKLELSEVMHNKYGLQYRVEGLPTFDKNELTEDDNFEMLRLFTTEKQARNICEAYPDFVSLVLNGEKDKIDIKKIHNVGEYYFQVYCNKIVENFTFFRLRKQFSELQLTLSESKKLLNKYEKIELCFDTLNEEPYYVLFNTLERPWIKVDEKLTHCRPDLKFSNQRCECLMMHILKLNEGEGNTRMSAVDLAGVAYSFNEELVPMMKEVALQGKYIHYDESTNWIALSSTYYKERRIADGIKELLNSSRNLNIKWQDYCENKGFVLTSEQTQLLRLINKNNIVMLTGGAGCVDCETEYFNGTKWKKISDYKRGDKVLQYDGNNTVSLVKPLKYICENNDFFYWINNGTSVNQMITKDHVVLYKKNNEIKRAFGENFIEKCLKDDFGGITINTFQNNQNNYMKFTIKKIIEKGYNPYYVKSKAKADYIQLALATEGISSTVYFEPNYKRTDSDITPMYAVQINRNDKMNNCSVTKITSSDGKKYCFTVPSGMLVLRREGRIFITGNCGKTSTVQCLINMLEDNGLECTLVSPTGIASKRLAETTGHNAYTIHRLFNQLKGEQITTNVLVVDEISMCGVEHLDMIFNMIDTSRTKLVLIGDEAQLSSIACGNILHDLLNYEKVPKANLTKVFRYGKGSLDTVATDVRNGIKFIDENDKPCFKGVGDDNQYEYIPIGNNDPIKLVIQQYDKLRQIYKPDEIMILNPYNVGKTGNYVINTELQKKYNSQNNVISISLKYHTVDFGVKDRVLNTVNNYETEIFKEILDDKEIETTCVFNGDIGTVRKVDTENNILVVQFDEQLVLLEREQIEKLLLGNAITVHKSQGSQFKAIILLTSSGNLLTRNLMYVGLTRAEEKIIHIGNTDVINESLEFIETDDRNTWLLDMLQED